MAIHGNPSRYGGRGVQYLSTSRSSSRNLNLTPNLRHQDKLRLPPSLWTYHDLSGFTWSKWIKQMNQHGLDGCVMLQISLIKASSANDSTGSNSQFSPPLICLTFQSFHHHQSNNELEINQKIHPNLPISQSPNLPISQSPNAPQPEAALMPWGLAVTALKRSLVKGRRSTCRSMKPSALFSQTLNKIPKKIKIIILQTICGHILLVTSN